MAMAIIVVVMSVIARQFRPIQSNWGAQQAHAETIQNGRVLTDHVNRNLAKAIKITDVSDFSTTLGYIQFESSDGNDFRYEVDPNGYVQFGMVDDLSVLAGPVTKFQFTCHDACDIDTPITTVDDIRFVKVETTIGNSASSGRNKPFATAAFLYTNGNPGNDFNDITKVSSFEYNIGNGETPNICQIDATHYLCAYNGPQDDGWSVILTVNSSDWSISGETPFEFDIDKGLMPVLSKIDDTHYLCAYEEYNGDLFATVLIVDTGNWTISKATPFCFEPAGNSPELVQIDSTHYLCIYTNGGGGRAVVLTVNTGDWSVSKGNTSVYDPTMIMNCALEKIDSTHYLCAYSDWNTDGVSVVLTVNPSTWDVSSETPFTFDSLWGNSNFDLVKIDDTHYLCVHKGPGSDGWSVILTVNTGDWTISKESSFEFDPVAGAYPAISKIDDNHFLCTYSDKAVGGKGKALVLKVNTSDWTISGGDSFLFDDNVASSPDVVQVDATHQLCVYEGFSSDGMAVMIDFSDGIKIRP